jgi:hypothetical protein
VISTATQKLYELTQNGQVVAVRDLAEFGLKNSQAMVFAPSGDQTDDPSQMSLYVADRGLSPKRASTPQSPFKATFKSAAYQTTTVSQGTGQIVELSFLVPASLPSGTTLKPTTLVHVIDTSNAAWNPSAPDTSGVDYFPLTNRLLVSDSEVDEMPPYFPPAYKNVFFSTFSGTQTGSCSTTTPTRTGFSNEPTGVAVDRINNRIYFSDDDANKIFEVRLGPDNTYCTSDDIVTSVSVGSLYNIQDAEDIAYGNNTVYIGGGDDAEVYIIPLGPNGVLAGGDDGAMTHFDTASLGFSILEGLGYNWDSGTLLLASPASSDKYIGEVTTTGTLLRAYDLSYVSIGHREDAAYAPGSINPAINTLYISDRGTDNDSNPNENDGEIYEINIAGPGTPTPSRTPTKTSTPTNTFTPGPTSTPTNTFTPTSTFTATSTFTPGPSPTSSPTITPTPLPSSNPLFASFTGGGTVGGVSFADEDIVSFDGVTWSLFFDGSDVGLSSPDLDAFSIVDADTILMSFNNAVTIGTLAVAPQDVVQFDATSLGSVTAGTFSMYLDGSDVGLDTNSENVDAISLLPDGRVLISTTSSLSVPGVSGLDEDILAFTPTTLGDVTSGTWSMYFDGSDVGLAESSNEDVDALDVDPNGAIYLSTLGDFSVTGIAGFDEDVFICSPTSLGDVTACNYSPLLYFDGSTWGQSANDVDAFELLISGTFPTATPTNTATLTSTATNTASPTNTFTATPTFTATATFTATLTPTIGPSPTPTNTPTATATFTPSSTPTNTNTPGPTFTPTATFTPSPTSAVSDLIFADSFESGDFSAWTTASTGGGDLSVSAAAALVGLNGMQVVVNDTTNMTVTDQTPNAEPHYRARFYFDPNSISMADGLDFYLLTGYDTSSVFQVQFGFSAGNYRIRLRQTNDSAGTTSTAWINITDASHFIEIEWRAASAVGANDGSATLWIDGVQSSSLSGVDNDTRRIEYVRLGAVSGLNAGTLGTYYLDAFESRRQTYIGP